jgi:outer membrane biosynthesis protein TonB
MNIQRYTWPVIVAAGLHGTLFLMTPESTVAREKPAKSRDLPPIPETEKIVQITDESETSAETSGGGAALPTLPDDVVNLTEKTMFTTPRTETPVLHPLITETHSIVTPGDGSSNVLTKGIGQICSIGSLDRRPRATSQISPDYPVSLHQQGVSGSVAVEFDVDTLGRVTRAEAVRYTHHEFV